MEYIRAGGGMGQERSRQAVVQESDIALVHRPFRGLDRLTTARAAPPAAEAPSEAGGEDGAAVFFDAVADVTPLQARRRQRVTSSGPAMPGRAVTDPDAEALAELSDLVAGHAPFDISDSDEYVEGAMVGLDPRLLRRLRAGEFTHQAHLDLHGMTSDEARVAVEEFLARAYQGGKRSVLIIHGRGRNSKDQIPILKRRLTSWLGRGQSARRILAFTSARPCDGGTGALYVLLRRERHLKRPIRVTTGAKW
ncbi:MAG: Smr/MutS family protein [Candidatus Binatia bacterium]